MTLLLEVGPRLQVVLLAGVGALVVGYLLSQWWMTYAILKTGRG